MIAPFTAVHAQPNTINDSYPLDTAIWQNLNIPVCWENIGESPAKRASVENAVQATWEANSQVDFTGWGQCPNGNFAGIRIGIEDNARLGPHTKGMGTEMKGRPNGMMLNFTQENWGQRCTALYGLQTCIEWIAIHEFGHALAFGHEQKRDDTPFECSSRMEPGGGGQGNVIFTEWDQNSIMNYCSPNYNGHGRLSAIDILTVQAYYGRIPTYSTAKTLQIPVVRVGGSNYSASLSDLDGDGRFTLDAFASTTNQSSKPAVYDSSSLKLNLPLVKVVNGSNKVISLYSAIMQRHADGTLTILSTTQVQPVPETH
ncbi:hypothetical protein MNBD_GAMMA04-660 [hydrothermal vent metagenome]|uniref:Peptidase metallopeptidase domain-containing protein n=1 Tax=hydrothermal vent metagenome TaxID=652676 RepID=A0A3B0W6V0_9ZZZZ